MTRFDLLDPEAAVDKSYIGASDMAAIRGRFVLGAFRIWGIQ